MGAALAAAAVALGAFGAHGLEETLAAAGEPAVEAWDTATRYHLFGALAVVATGLAAYHVRCKGIQVAAALLTLGVLLFSGSLYAWALTDIRVLVFVTPLGGVSMILGLAALAWSCWSCGD